MTRVAYIVPQSPDDRILKRAISILENEGLIILPSDTNWLICANGLDKKAISKLYRYKNESESKHYSLICSSLSMISDLAHVYDPVFRSIRNMIPGHYTFIFPALKAMAKRIKATKTDKEIGIRIPPNQLIRTLVDMASFPLISTHLNAQMLGQPEGSYIYGALIEESMTPEIELIIDPGEYDFVGTSTVIDCTEDATPTILREGAGDNNGLAYHEHMWE